MLLLNTQNTHGIFPFDVIFCTEFPVCLEIKFHRSHWDSPMFYVSESASFSLFIVNEWQQVPQMFWKSLKRNNSKLRMKIFQKKRVWSEIETFISWDLHANVRLFFKAIRNVYVNRLFTMCFRLVLHEIRQNNSNLYQSNLQAWFNLFVLTN